MRIIYLSLIFMMVMISNPVNAVPHDVISENIRIENSYARETIPGTNISSAYMKVINTSSKAIRLVGASSQISERIELHEHTMTNGMMRMRQKQSVDIPANQEIIFQPSGLHLMIFDLKHPLKSAENVVITLHFDDKSSVNVTYAIKSIKQKKHTHH